MNEWQPIETAPRDGTHIVIARYGWDVLPLAFWGDIDGEDGPFGGWLFVDGHCTGLPGESGTELGWQDDIDADDMPTHWMPAPPRPKA